MATIILSLLLTLWISWFLARPHFASAAEESGAAQMDESLQSLVEQKERSVQVLKDLELDFSMGKIAEGDYQQMKRSLYAELNGLLERIEKR